MDYSIGEVAERAGVTVRTLHHYDTLGLLVPRRDGSGARRYTDEDMDRLAEVLTYRALGVELGSIRAILAGDDEPVAVLRRRRSAVADHLARLGRVLEDLDERLEGVGMDPDKVKEIFGDFDPDAHAAEAEERWGHTDAYKESMRRTSTYQEQEWEAIKAEGADIGNRFGVLLDAGVDPEADEAMDIAEEHRQHISRWFYECSYEIHTGLGEGYVSDPRFTRYWDEGFGVGVAVFVRDAIAANAIRNI